MKEPHSTGSRHQQHKREVGLARAAWGVGGGWGGLVEVFTSPPPSRLLVVPTAEGALSSVDGIAGAGERGGGGHGGPRGGTRADPRAPQARGHVRGTW